MPAITRILAAAILGLVVTACGSGSGLGYDQAPASLDPNSPKVSAVNIAFDHTDIDVPAGQAFTLVFENRESVDHNVSVYTDAAAQTRLFEGKIYKGPGTRWYPVPALATGTYVFRCDIHADMSGRLHAS